jgi:hypothetical protein
MGQPRQAGLVVGSESGSCRAAEVAPETEVGSVAEWRCGFGGEEDTLVRRPGWFGSRSPRGREGTDWWGSAARGQAAGREAEVKENSAGRSRARRRLTETSPRRHVLLFRHLALRAASTHRAIMATSFDPYYLF